MPPAGRKRLGRKAPAEPQRMAACDSGGGGSRELSGPEAAAAEGTVCPTPLRTQRSLGDDRTRGRSLPPSPPRGQQYSPPACAPPHVCVRASAVSPAAGCPLDPPVPNQGSRGGDRTQLFCRAATPPRPHPAPCRPSFPNTSHVPGAVLCRLSAPKARNTFAAAWSWAPISFPLPLHRQTRSLS